MWWVVGYLAIGWLCLAIGVFQYRATRLPWGVALALFLGWPLALAMAIWQSITETQDGKR